MKKIIVAGFACFTLFACNSGSDQTTTNDSSANTNAATQDTAWTSLFNGETITGWHNYGSDSVGKAWQVDSGAIHLNSSVKNGGGDLVTDDTYGDFDLKLDWKISKNGNSGIIFYVQEDTAKYDETYKTGPEMQVLDNEGHPDAKIPKHRAGDLYDLISSSSEPVKPAGEWNHAEIKSVNGKLDLYLNDVNVVSTTMWDDNWKQLIAGSKFKNMPDFGTFKSGHIALQNHGDDVWFKNIMIRKM